MIFPEGQRPLISEPARQSGANVLPRTEVARIISATESKYLFQQYLPEDVDAGLNLPTTLAAMHAIDAKGSEQGWEYQDLLNVLPITRAALTTAGFVNAKEGLTALLAGATGDLRSIIKKILPPDAPKAIKRLAKTMVWANSVDNMRVVGGLLIDEKKLEVRLLRLTRLQQDILLNPGKTRALLGLLNGEYSGSSSLAVSGLPQEAKTHLVRISPFSLEDMTAVNKLFNAVEKGRDSTIQIESHRMKIETELKRLDAAGINIAKIVSMGAESVTKNTLLILAGPVEGTLSGLVVGCDKIVGGVEKAIDTVKHNVAERKAAKVHTPRMYEATVG